MTSSAALGNQELAVRPAFVLVVDDDADCREIVALLLEGEGHACELAADGKEALDAMRDATPAAVVLDMMMPGVNGLDVLRAMRAVPRLAGVPVFLVSAAPRSEYADALRDPRLRAVPKPLDVDTLLDRFHELVPHPGLPPR